MFSDHTHTTLVELNLIVDHSLICVTHIEDYTHSVLIYLHFPYTVFIHDLHSAHISFLSLVVYIYSYSLYTSFKINSKYFAEE